MSRRSSQDAFEAWLRMDELNRLLLESTADGIYGTDVNGLTTFINPAAAKMTGWTAEELLGKPHLAFVHPLQPEGTPSPPEPFAAVGALQLGAVRRGEDAILWRKDGSSFPVAYTGTSILRHGKSLGTVVVFRDISLKRRKEQWEQSRNEIFAAILSHILSHRPCRCLRMPSWHCIPVSRLLSFWAQGSRSSLAAEAGLPKRLPRVLRGLLPTRMRASPGIRIDGSAR